MCERVFWLSPNRVTNNSPACVTSSAAQRDAFCGRSLCTAPPPQNSPAGHYSEGCYLAGSCEKQDRLSPFFQDGDIIAITTSCVHSMLRLKKVRAKASSAARKTGDPVKTSGVYSEALGKLQCTRVDLWSCRETCPTPKAVYTNPPNQR